MLSLLRSTCPALRPLLFQRQCVQNAVRWYSEDITESKTPSKSTTVSPLPQNGWNNNIVGQVISETASEPLKTAEQIWAEKSAAAHAYALRFPPANAYSGRSVEVKSGDLSAAFNKLSTILAKNKIRQQLRQAERHEKRGVKRRRLSSERWRRRFSEEVRKKVQLVEQIRMRGA